MRNQEQRVSFPILQLFLSCSRRHCIRLYGAGKATGYAEIAGGWGWGWGPTEFMATIISSLQGGADRGVEDGDSVLWREEGRGNC